MQTRRTLFHLAALGAAAATPGLAQALTPSHDTSTFGAPAPGIRPALNAAIDAHPCPAGLVMSKRTRKRLFRAENGLGGLNVAWHGDAQGASWATYRDLRIVTVDYDEKNAPLLDQGEVLVLRKYDFERCLYWEEQRLSPEPHILERFPRKFTPEDGTAATQAKRLTEARLHHLKMMRQCVQVDVSLATTGPRLARI